MWTQIGEEDFSAGWTNGTAAGADGTVGMGSSNDLVVNNAQSLSGTLWYRNIYINNAGTITVSSGETLELTLLGSTYAIAWPELTISFSDGRPCPEELAILFLDYMTRADGSRPTEEWIGFQELPDGSFYRHAFQGYSGDQLVRDLGADTDRFRRSAAKLDGEQLSTGDAGYAFRVLPHGPMAVVWWDGDDEFPANATVLFDRIAGTYLPTDGLAILGRMLCRALVRVGDSP